MLIVNRPKNDKALEGLVSLMRGFAKSTIFSVRFVKKDGSIRDMRCRFGVKSKLKHPDKPMPKPKSFTGNITVFDLDKGEYRAIAISRLIHMQIKGVEYTRVPNHDHERHGGAYDRGAADRWYRRAYNPHKFVGPTEQSEQVFDLTLAEQIAYRLGWDEQEDFKDWE